jgi:hypothetical protein
MTDPVRNLNLLGAIIKHIMEVCGWKWADMAEISYPCEPPDGKNRFAVRNQLPHVVKRGQRSWVHLPALARGLGVSVDVLTNEAGILRCKSDRILGRRYGIRRADIMAQMHDAQRRHADLHSLFDQNTAFRRGFEVGSYKRKPESK